MTSECEEKIRLTRKYGDASEWHTNAVRELAEGVGTLPKAEFDQLRVVVESARTAREQARSELEQHLRVHGC